jgi:hypothetical protein
MGEEIRTFNYQEETVIIDNMRADKENKLETP